MDPLTAGLTFTSMGAGAGAGAAGGAGIGALMSNPYTAAAAMAAAAAAYGFSPTVRKHTNQTIKNNLNTLTAFSPLRGGGGLNGVLGQGQMDNSRPGNFLGPMLNNLTGNQSSQNAQQQKTPEQKQQEAQQRRMGGLGYGSSGFIPAPVPLYGGGNPGAQAFESKPAGAMNNIGPREWNHMQFPEPGMQKNSLINPLGKLLMRKLANG